MKRAAGFTLLEVLAALVLLAMLLVGVYSGVRTAAHSVRSGTATIERIDQVRAAQQFLRRELAQSMAQPIGHTKMGEPVFFEGSEHQMRYVAPLPGYLGRLGPQLQQLDLQDDGHGGMRLVLSLALLPPDGSPPKPLGDSQVLIDHLKQGQFSYSGMDAKGQLMPWSYSWPDGRSLPQLVSIKLQPQGTIEWPELAVPLRANASAAMGQAQAGPRMGLNNGGLR